MFLVTSSLSPLRLFRALLFDAVQPFQFFFLFAQLLNPPCIDAAMNAEGFSVLGALVLNSSFCASRVL